MSLAKLVVINDNVGVPGLLNDWGLSIYIEANGKRVLFDADTSPEIITYNARLLGIDLRKLDFAVLSHHHGDHYGGFSAVASAKPGITIYMPPGDSGWARSLPIKAVDIREPTRIAPGFWLSGPLEAWHGFYEQALGVEVNDYLAVLVGCSHPGVDRLVYRLYEITGKPVLLVVGGFHEPSFEQLENISRIAKYVCPMHCSGLRAKKYIATNYPEKYCEAKTGSRITITKSLAVISEDFPY